MINSTKPAVLIPQILCNCRFYYAFQSTLCYLSPVGCNLTHFGPYFCVSFFHWMNEYFLPRGPNASLEGELDRSSCGGIFHMRTLVSILYWNNTNCFIWFLFSLRIIVLLLWPRLVCFILLHSPRCLAVVHQCARTNFLSEPAHLVPGLSRFSFLSPNPT